MQQMYEKHLTLKAICSDSQGVSLEGSALFTSSVHFAFEVVNQREQRKRTVIFHASGAREPFAGLALRVHLLGCFFHRQGVERASFAQSLSYRADLLFFTFLQSLSVLFFFLLSQVAFTGCSRVREITSESNE